MAGDGREYVVARADAVKIRAEDGRSVAGVDISAMIGDLPGGRSTQKFSTPNASGSTSQAANIAEALEVGTSLFLVDEDTSATNFMIRDERMRELVRKEPITPFIDLVRPLHRTLGVSTVVVVGGVGDYLDVADRVILMEDYEPSEATPTSPRGHIEVPAPRPRRRQDIRPAERPPRPGVLDRPAARQARDRPRQGSSYYRAGPRAGRSLDLEQLAEAGQTEAIGPCHRRVRRRGREPPREGGSRGGAGLNSGEGLDSLGEFRGHPGE